MISTISWMSLFSNTWVYAYDKKRYGFFMLSPRMYLLLMPL